MEVTSFVVAGPQAHFRKFYGTNTALSYYLPPRTTLMGLLAARCGWDKDSYHERLHSSRIRIGVGAETPLRKSFHRVNNLKIKGGSDFRGRDGHQQTPLELVSGLRIGRDEVAYRVWLASVAGSAEGAEAYEALHAALSTAPASAYACCLGAAFCIASIREVARVEAREVAAGKYLSLRSAVAVDAISAFGSREGRGRLPDGVRVEEEILPADFAPDIREPTNLVRAVYSTGHMPIPLTLTVPAYAASLSEGAGATAFTFLENVPSPAS